MFAQSTDLKHLLSHVLWLGGATDAGKTTISQLLAERHELQIYNYDQQDVRQSNHLAQTLPHIFNHNRTDEERWLQPEPEELVERARRSFRLRLPLVIGELLALPSTPLILAEGFGLTPELIAPLLSSKHQAIWLVPTEEFKWMSMKQRDKFTRRLQMSDPERAINNLFVRDMTLAQFVTEQAQARGLRVYEVDGARSPEAMATMVEQHFAPFLRRGDQP
jgi:2-phosphoglycerate kinase